MKLSEVLKNMNVTIHKGDIDLTINEIQYDSRKVSANDVFVCITGFQTDGHVYAKNAAQQGAVAIICEHLPEGDFENATVIEVANCREALAKMSANFYHHPSEKLRIIGVTGTNGKTTTTYLLKSILDKNNCKIGIIGTIENRIGDEILQTQRTTPESKELQELFDRMKKNDVTDVMMEVSSHALDLHRVDEVAFEVGIFTNLTQDHLDYHKTMENYKKAKAMLFSRCKTSIINIDDDAGEEMKACASGKVLTFGIEKQADLQAENIVITPQGTSFSLTWDKQTYPIFIHTPGRFSVYNALGAIGAAIALGLDMQTIVEGLEANQGVSGRFQTVISQTGVQAVVDYAHTPDGLDNILKTAQEFAKGRILTVFGCGGDRDKTKRPIMGEIAGEKSDFCIITSDNPRTENPNVIMDEVEVGTAKTNCPYEKIADRREAINFAAQMAKKDDVIIIAGKGHETYQIFADETIHFDDVEEIRKAFGEAE